MEIELQQNQFVLNKHGSALFIKRDDLIHPTVSGNKFRKLKYNLIAAKEAQCSTLLTFGGAYSNHIAATAAAGRLEGFKTIGIIRGEELAANLNQTLAKNPTLAFAHECGMHLEFISRSQYREKNDIRFRESIYKTYNHPYIIPEGGTNNLAVKGCQEILTPEDATYDFICCAAGTGGTSAGIINSLAPHQKVLVFPALKGNWMADELRKYTINQQWEVVSEYHFGGYAKVNAQLVAFINSFKAKYNIPLDPIYTGKMMYGTLALMEKGFFPENSRILAVHTGGLQGIAGINQQLQQKGLPLIVN